MKMTEHDFFNSTHLQEVLESVKPASWLDSLFFSDQRRVGGYSVTYDIAARGNQLAPYVATKIGSQTVQINEGARQGVKTVVIGANTTISEGDLEEAISGGGVFLDGRDIPSALRDIQLERTIQLHDRVQRTLEKQAADLLQTGKTSLEGLGLPSGLELDIWGPLHQLGYDDPVTKVPAGPNTKWGEANGAPLDDFERAINDIIDNGGQAPNIAIFGVTAAKHFQADPAWQLRQSDRARAGIAPADAGPLPSGALYFGQHFGVDCYVYGQAYGGSSSTRYVHEDRVILGNSLRNSNFRVFSPVSLVHNATRSWEFGNEKFNIIQRFQASPEEGMNIAVKTRSLPVIRDIYDFRVIETQTEES